MPQILRLNQKQFIQIVRFAQLRLSKKTKRTINATKTQRLQETQIGEIQSHELGETWCFGVLVAKKYLFRQPPLSCYFENPHLQLCTKQSPPYS